MFPLVFLYFDLYPVEAFMLPCICLFNCVLHKFVGAMRKFGNYCTLSETFRIQILALLFTSSKTLSKSYLM